MTKKRRAEWQVRVYGEQREEIELDLLLQIVIMLGRHLAHEAQATEQDGPDSSSTREEES